MNFPRTALVAVMSGIGLARTGVSAATALLATIVLEPAGRGVMVIAVTVCSIVGLLSTVGTGPALRALLARAVSTARRRLLAGYLWCTLGGVAVAGAVSAGASVATAGAVDPGLAEPLVLVAVAVFAGATVLLQQITDLWFADGRFRRGSVAALVATAAGAAGVGAALMIERSPGALLLGQGVGTLVGCLAQVPPLAGAGLLTAGRPRHRDLLDLLRRGVGALGLTGGLAIALRADRYVLGLAAGPAAVGVYALAATLAEAARNLPIAIGQIYLRETALGAGAAALARTSCAAVVGVGVAGGLVLAAAPVVLPLFEPAYAGAGGLLVVLVVGELCFAPFSVASRGLVGGGWTTAAGVLGTAGGLVAVGAYAVGAVAFGALGTAVASVVVYAALSAAAYALLRARLVRSREVDVDA